MDKQTRASQSLFNQVRSLFPFRGTHRENSMDKQTAAQLIHDRAFALVLDAKRWPETREAAHRYVCLAIRWALSHRQDKIATNLSRMSLEIGES